MKKEIFNDVIIEYIYFDNCDIICTSFEGEYVDPEEIPDDE